MIFPVFLFCWEEKLLNSLKRLLKFLGGFHVEHVLVEHLLELPLWWLLLCLKVWYSLWSFKVAKGNKLLEQNMHIQNLSEPVVFIISASTTFKLLHFKWNMVRHNEHPIRFLQPTDLLHLSQLTFVDIRPDKSIKKKKKMWWLSLWKLCYHLIRW